MAAITLSPAAPDITLSGVTSAYGTIGTYYINSQPGRPNEHAPVEAAIFGAAGTNFNVLSAGTILSAGASRFDAGIVLGGVGEVKDTGTIIAPSGVFILGYLENGAYAGNFGTIIATKGDAIDALGNAGVNNSGYISAASAGIFDRGGLVENFGTIIAGQTGIFQVGGTGINNGVVLATGKGAGIVTYGAFTNSTTGIIASAKETGLFGDNFSTMYNNGLISGKDAVGILSKAAFYNTGTVTGSSAGVYSGRNLNIYADGPAYITNYAGGLIAGKRDGVQAHLADVHIYNYGLITGNTGATGYGLILNAATIAAKNIGAFLYSGLLTNTGTITGNTAVVAHPVKNELFHSSPTIINQGIISGQAGIRAEGGTVFNAGYIQARADAGISLTAHGQVYNGVTGTLTGTLTGTIAGASAGVSLAKGGTVANAGLITSGGGDGVDLSAGAALYNRSTITRQNGIYTSHFGTISGARYGVSLAGAGYLYNDAGTISGGTAAIYMRGVTNASSAAGTYTYLYNRGTISSTQDGILSRYGTIDIASSNTDIIARQTAILAANAYINLAAGYVGGGAAGIILTQGGTVISTAGIGARGAGSDGIYLGAAGGTVVSRGDLSAEYGIVMAGSGFVYASAVQGFSIGVNLKSGGTIVAGSIYGPDAITIDNGGTVIARSFSDITGDVLFGAGANRLVLDPGAKIQGLYISGGTRGAATVNLSGGTLELAAAAGATGTVSQFEAGGASAITIDKAANWVLAGYSFGFRALITNDGAIDQTYGNGATIAADITGTGGIDIKRGTITLDGAVGTGQTVKFGAAAGELALGLPSEFAATLQNFSAFDTINLVGIPLSDVQGLSFAAGVLTLDETAGALTFTFSNPATFAHETFAAFAAGAGTGITLAPAAGSATLPTPTQASALHFLTINT